MIPIVEEFFQNEDDFISNYDAQQKAIAFAKLHVEAALKAASDSRCLNMFDKKWFAYSLEPGSQILYRINIIIDKPSIIDSYPLDNIK